MLKPKEQSNDSIIRRINNRISGLLGVGEDEIDFQSENMKYIMNLVTEAFLRIFNSDIIYSSEELSNNLIILNNFFKNYPKFGGCVLCFLKYLFLYFNA